MNVPIIGEGVYNLSSEQYHTDNLLEVPTLNSSSIWSLTEQSPLHCWQQHPRFGGGELERIKKRHMEMGSAVHATVLGSNDKMVEVSAGSYRTQLAREARDTAYERWEIPLLTTDFAECQVVATKIKERLARHRDASSAFTGGQPEATLIWQEAGVWCRARLDYLADRAIYDDLKTTPASANPDKWVKWNLFSNGCDIQAAFYIRGIKALGLHKRPIFRFIVAETRPPYGLSAIACSETLITYADMKVEQALKTWRECLERNEWPGYANSTVWADVPAYLFAEAEERRLRTDKSWDEIEEEYSSRLDELKGW